MHTLAGSLMCDAEHQRMSFTLKLAAVCFCKNHPSSLSLSQQIKTPFCEYASQSELRETLKCKLNMRTSTEG